MKSFILLFFITFAAFPALAQVNAGGNTTDMAFPLRCTPGISCFIIGYPDLNKAPGKGEDFACGPADDGEMFLRIGLPDVSTITRNIPVLAAGDGVVADATDGIPDRVVTSRAELKRGISNCGNGVVIDHGGGTQTAYCHLRKDSLQVKSGDRVTKGQVIGAVGQSGVALWPQLGFSLVKGGYFIDPITSTSDADGCGLRTYPALSMPQSLIPYQPAAIVSLGFSIGTVPAEKIALGTATRYAFISKEEKTINMWGMILGIRKGDRIEVTIFDPRGRAIYDQNIIAESDKLRLPINAARKRGYVGWREGAYAGQVKVTRTINYKPHTVMRQVVMIVE